MNEPQPDKKLQEAVLALEHALSFEDKISADRFYFSGISKSFEVCLEYAWKYLKRLSIDEGLEPFSPKDAVKMAGRLGVIDNVEAWLNFIDDRNLAVHDYLSVSDEDYLKTVKAFLAAAKRLVSR